MNIFVVDHDPVVAAHSLCLKHLVKMPSETVMMLQHAFSKNEKSGYYFHPCSIWCRESRDNYQWLIQHGIALCDAYKHAYKREHASYKKIKIIEDNYHFLDFPKSGLTPFARAFSQYKQMLDSTVPDTVEAYRKFYILDKPFAKWPELNKIPDWWIEKNAKYVDKNFINGNYTKR